MGTERNVARDPDSSGAFDKGVRLPLIGDDLNVVTLSQALDHLLPYSSCVFIGSE